jgi:capsular polysaccharide biosynthesis protein
MKSTQTKILGLALLIIGLALCGFGLSLLLSPPEYVATVRIHVANDEFSNKNRLGVPYSDGGFDPYFVVDAAREIQMNSLTNAIEALNLNEVWGEKFNQGHKLEMSQSIKRLKRKLCIIPEESNKWARPWKICVKSENPVEAARLANAIAKCYVDYVGQLFKQKQSNELEALQEQLLDEQKQIQTMQTNVDELRSHFSVVGDPTGSWGQAYPEAKQKLDQLIKQHSLFAAKINAIKIDAQISKTSMVQIIDPAEPPKFPIGPNRFLSGALLAVGFIFALGGIFLLKPEK